jgi:hypothetical protein
MEKRTNKNFMQALFAALGIGGMAFVGYLFYKKFLKNKLLTNRNTNTSLSKEDAMRRSELISHLKYTIQVQLNHAHVEQTKNIYEGSVLIEFDLSKVEDLFIDFMGKVISITNQGKAVPFTHENGKIYLSAKDLAQHNKINVVFSNQYSLESKGMRIYTDTTNMVKILLTL